MIRHYFSYIALQIFIIPLSFLPSFILHPIAHMLGIFSFYSLKKYRKRALSNLAMVEAPWAKNPQAIRKIAIESFQNLAITCLEYPKLARRGLFSLNMQCINPQNAEEILKKGHGIIFFCGHQANWEVLFLEGTRRMPGTAIGRPIKNPFLYRWITSIREKNGGKMLTPKSALREGLKALKEGKFLGILGDQGMPESSYSYSFFGKRAWTSPAPVLLAYRAKCPIITATIVRKKRKYLIEYAKPIWPDFNAPLETQIDTIMAQILLTLEQSIQKHPGQWLWIHNRWKQQTPRTIYYRFRNDPILIILPDEENAFHQLLPHLLTFKEIFPQMFLSFFIPQKFSHFFHIQGVERLFYAHPHEIFIEDFRFKLIFNLTNHLKIHQHFKRLSALEIFTENDLKKIASEHLTPKTAYTFSDILKRATCRPGTLW